jgi:PKHD-type hydroxylase
MYSSVTFDELQDSRDYDLTFRTLTDVLTEEECKSIIDSARMIPCVENRMTWGNQDQFSRSTDIFWITPNDSNIWLFSRIANAIKFLNNSFFQFSLDGNIRSLQLGRYNVQQGYCWHHDLGKVASRRKLSLTIQLSQPSSYEGGNLEFFQAEKVAARAPRNLGSLTAFPSWSVHRVTDIIDGERWSLVSWLEGAPFR